MLESLIYRDRPAPADWCERNLVMPPKTSGNRPGPLSFSGQEYIREILENLRRDAVSHVYVCAAAQVCKTVVDLCAFAYMRCHEPQGTLWALPDKGLARAFVEERFAPFITSNPCLLGDMRAQDVRGLSIPFDSFNCNFVGVNNPGELSSRPVSFVIMDEAGKFEHRKKREAEPQDLIEDRTHGFARKKLFITSTPSTAEQPFWAAYHATDRQRWYVPCPHCNSYFPLEFNRQSVIWDRPSDPTAAVPVEVVRHTARYVCPRCRREIDQTCKAAMIAAGRWVAENTEHTDAARRGYHLNALYSAFRSWGDVAADFVLATRRAMLDPYALQNFYNSDLAIPYELQQVRVQDESVKALIDPSYDRGVPPVPPVMVTVTYDVHQTHQDWVLCAFAITGEQWVIDWGQIAVIDDIPRHYVTVTDPYRRNGVICRGLVDSGFNTLAVYRMCMECAGEVWPSKGTPRARGTWGQIDLGDNYPGLVLYVYSDHAQKMLLYSTRIQQARGNKLHLPRNADQALLDGLKGQELVKKPGRRYPEWKELPNDHYGDCVKLAQVTWQVMEAYLPREESTVYPQA